MSVISLMVASPGGSAAGEGVVGAGGCAGDEGLGMLGAGAGVAGGAAGTTATLSVRA